MHEESIIGVAITLLSGLFSMVVFPILLRKQKSKPLKLLFISNLFLNFIWYSTLLFYLLRSIFPTPGDPLNIYWLEFIAFSLLYVLRFGLMFSILLLFWNLLGLKISERIESIIIKAVVFLIFFWFVGWIEIPMLGSKSITNQLMVLTDFLIFATVIIAAIYVSHKSIYIFNKEFNKAVKQLCVIIIILFAIGSVKLVISTSLMKIASILERSLIYVFISTFNIAITLWVVKYAGLLKDIKRLRFNKQGVVYDNFLKEYHISKREGEVVQLICEGKSNKEIAAQLFISIDTVKDHNYKIYQKVGVKSRMQLVNLITNFKSKIKSL